MQTVKACDSIYLHPLPSVVVCNRGPSCHQLCSYWLWTHFYDTGSYPKSQEALLSFWQCLCLSRQVEPLSSCSIVEMCILPILLCGGENWVMSAESIKMLECFQGEIAKRILQLPKWYSNTTANVVYTWLEFPALHVYHQEVKILAQGHDK